MEQIGIVTALTPQGTLVTVQRTTACGQNCKACAGGCTPTPTQVTAVNPCGAKEGDCVVLELPTAQVLAGAALLYLTPVVTLFVVYVGAASFTALEWARWSAAVFGLLCSFFFTKSCDIRAKKSKKYAVSICRVLHSSQ